MGIRRVRINSEDKEWFRRLERQGCPLDNAVLEDSERTSVVSLPITIRAQGAPLENVLFHILPGFCGCWMSIACATDCSDGVHIQGIELQLPFGDVHLE